MIKTLAELKRNAKNFEWKMIKHSWFKEIRAELKAFREVAEITNKHIAFYTQKNGYYELSYIDLPKAINLIIEKCTHKNEEGYCVTFISECVITYFLRHK